MKRPPSESCRPGEVDRSNSGNGSPETTPLNSAGDLLETSSPPKSAEEILSRVAGQRTVIEDFRPLADSIEWNLGKLYWNERGLQAFLGGDVPYVINNDGYLSANAARLLFANVEESEQNGELEPRVLVLEIGVGSGLFARLFLNSFRDLCTERNRDYYERLLYIAADRSERMLADIAKHEILSDHADHHELHVVDAMDPFPGLRAYVEPHRGDVGPFRSVFLNYTLDQLPATVVTIDGGEVKHLLVRTCLARGVDLEDFTSLQADELACRAASADLADQRELVDLYELFSLDCDYCPIDPRTLPYGEFVCRFAESQKKYTLHNYGAIQCLEHSLHLLCPQGFILIHDYPHHLSGDSPEELQHQRFGGSTQIGINFPLLQSYFQNAQGVSWTEPSEDNEHIYARMLGRVTGQETIGAFHHLFSKATFDSHHEPTIRARNLIKAGRREAGMTAYLEALRQQPNNWMLMGEVAEFLIAMVDDHEAGLEMVTRALNLNPISHELWNVLGDSLFNLKRADEAHRAFLHALELSPTDVRARYNLIHTFLQRKDPASALRMIADGLCHDQAEEYRDRLLQRQSEILGRMTERRQQLTRYAANRWNWVNLPGPSKEQAAE